MSNDQTAAAPAPAASAPATPADKATEVPKPAPAPEDTLLRLAQTEIPAEQQRLKQLIQKGEITPQQCMIEMQGTVLSLIKDLARGLVETRDWSFHSMSALAESTGDHLEAVESRLDVMEEFGGDTTILPDDAEVLKNVINACQYLAKHVLSGPFPIESRDDDGKQKLAEVIVLCEQADKIVTDSTVIPDEDDEDLELDDLAEDSDDPVQSN